MDKTLINYSHDAPPHSAATEQVDVDGYLSASNFGRGKIFSSAVEM